ncbi:MAG: HlyD family efflux transporter periplasmic adaptor subunit [Bdellovibrionales bacterium]|nr:HlyD family efflux transporter periplasmic adaptor subunit [Bdellovibrionales bacterium]
MLARSKKTCFRIGLVIVAGVAIWFFTKPKEIVVETAEVRISDFLERIESDGVLRSKTRIIVPAFAAGEMGRMDLKVGETVKKGQTITTLLWDYERGPLRAPIEGVISKVFRESAGPVQRGEPIVEVIDPRNLEIATEVLTLDATRIKVGNPAVIRGWGGEGAVPARVVRVSKAGFVKVSTLGVEEERTEVVLEIESGQKDLRREWGSTFHVDVEIEVSKLPSQLVIPVGALVRAGEGWMVWKVVEGRAIGAPIRVRAISGGLAALAPSKSELNEGLLAGDSVILYPGDLIHERMRVKSTAVRR